MTDLFSWSEQGRLLELFGVGTAVVVAAVSRIGYKDKDIRTTILWLGPHWTAFVDYDFGHPDW
jgi:hypothetical protein